MAAIVTVVFAFVEALGGWWTGSLALLSDAGHMLTDGAALALSAIAAWMAQRPPSERHSYGLGRAEVFAALANAATMLVIVLGLGYEAVVRLNEPTPVNGGAAALIALTGWTRADPVASLVICVLIALSSWRLLRESLHALMEGVPHGLSVEDIGGEMARIDGVLSVHDLHVWTLSGSRTALSAHVVIKTMGQWERLRAELQERLHERFGIDHVTLQPESTTRPLVRR